MQSVKKGSSVKENQFHKDKKVVIQAGPSLDTLDFQRKVFF